MGGQLFTSYEIIKSICDEFCVAPSKMCEDIGLSKSLMSSLKSGRTKGINEKTAQAIADYFNVSLSRVIHGIDETADNLIQLSSKELELLYAYRQAPQAIKDIVDVALRPYWEASGMSSEK